MELTQDEIKTIRQCADKLEQWSENLSYDIRPAKNLWVELTLSLYPQNVQGIASRLADIPAAGEKAGNAFEELAKYLHEIDAWRNQGVYPEELGDFCVRINRLIKVTRNIISIMRNISGSGEPEKSETKTKTVEKSNAPQEPEHESSEALSEEAVMAYKLHFESGLTIQQVARQMTSRLKLDKALRPFQISRWIKQAEGLHKHSRIPIHSVAPKESDIKAKSTKTDSTET